MEVFFDDLDVLFESEVVLNIVFGQSHSDKKGIIELLVDPQIIAYEVLPCLTTDLDRHTTFEGFFETSA